MIKYDMMWQLKVAVVSWMSIQGSHISLVKLFIIYVNVW